MKTMTSTDNGADTLEITLWGVKWHTYFGKQSLCASSEQTQTLLDNSTPGLALRELKVLSTQKVVEVLSVLHDKKQDVKQPANQVSDGQIANMRYTMGCNRQDIAGIGRPTIKTRPCEPRAWKRARVDEQMGNWGDY